MLRCALVALVVLLATENMAVVSAVGCLGGNVTEVLLRIVQEYQLQFKSLAADILKELSPGLREDILRFNSKELFKKVPLLGSSPHAFGAKLASALLPSVHFKDECIFFEDSRGDTMYFIYTGVVEVSSKYKKNAKGASQDPERRGR